MTLSSIQIDHVKSVLGITASQSPDVQSVMGQWHTLIWEGVAIARFNLRADTTLVFSAYVAQAGVNYDAFLEVKEPELAIPVPAGVQCWRSGNLVNPDQKIAGIICQDGPRFSFSNPNAPQFDLSEDGTLKIGDQTWYLHTLQMPDARRVVNYNAFFGKKWPQDVKVVELGELEMYQG